MTHQTMDRPLTVSGVLFADDDPASTRALERALDRAGIYGTACRAAGVLSKVARDEIRSKAKEALEKAKKSAAAGERLYKSGVLAKVEAENRAMKVIRLETDLAEARLEAATQAVAVQQTRLEAGEISQGDLEIAKSALIAATSEALT